MVQMETIKEKLEAGKVWAQTHKKQLAAAGYFACGLGAAMLFDHWNISGNCPVTIIVEPHKDHVCITSSGKKKIGYTSIMAICERQNALKLAQDIINAAKQGQ